MKGQMIGGNVTKVQAVIWSNRNLECERAENLLLSVDEDVRVFYVDKDFTQRGFEAEFGENAEYPQISIGLKHRGTLKETLNYLKDNGTIQ
tara:strand:- start:308 stop:580 length:273 start_codon:yes stop_codon:yes gene_type:complete